VNLDKDALNVIEFQDWDVIPDTHKRGEGEDREVYGLNFLDQPTWIPWMGQP
jgi:hypothetical protein